jgi:hypothetical protein
MNAKMMIRRSQKILLKIDIINYCQKPKYYLKINLKIILVQKISIKIKLSLKIII